MSVGVVRGDERRLAGDAVISVSDAAATNSEQFVRSSCHTIPNGVDSQQFHPAEAMATEPTLLFVGRLVRNKGPQILLEALPSVMEQHPDIRVRIIGTGPMQSSLESGADALGIADRITFLGHVESVAAEMNRATVFCRPSFSEGLPLTLLEAMASELPAVVTPVGGVPEVVVDGKTGLLVDTDSPTAITHAVCEIFDDPGRASKIGRAAREYVVDRHSWKRRTERVLDVYHQTCDRSEDPLAGTHLAGRGSDST